MKIDDEARMVLLASRALLGVTARSLAATDTTITLSQYRVLELLDSEGDQAVGAFTDALGIQPSMSTRACDQLMGKGMIQWAPSAECRGEVAVRLAPAGRALVRNVAERRRTELHRLLRGLRPDERTSLIDALSVFDLAARERSDDPWTLGWTA